jgi:hypothetical protein
MFFFFSNRGEDEEEETKQLLEFDAGSSFVNVVAVNWSTRKFVPLPRSVPHDNRGNLWPAHVSLPRVDPKAKRQNRDPNWGSINTDTCPRRRRKEKFAEIGDTRAAGLHLIFAAAGNNFRCLFRSVCLIPCFSFFFRFGRTLGPAHALHQQSMSLLRPNWKNNLSVSGIILGFVFIFISSPNTRRQIISFDFFF